MFERFARACVFLLIGTVLVSPASAQVVVPPPAQAQQMLQNNPALIQQLQQMLRSSGMTPDQVRARLKAQGYPDSLLDQYLPGGRISSDSLAVPTDDVFAAVRKLGIADSTSVDSLRSMARGRREVSRDVARVRDSAFLDTIQRAIRANDTTAAVIRTLLRSRELRKGMVDSGFKVYGLDLFDKETTQFDANTVGGADPNYRLGPGDQLTLVLTGDVEKNYPRLTVSRDGQILIPDAGLVNVAGQTLSQLTDILYNRLGGVYSGVRRSAGATTRFYVTLAQIGNNQVYVNGDVVAPGSYRPSRAGTVMTALHMAGGPTPTGSLRNVQVRRGGQLVATLDIYDYALRGDLSGDIRLENNDVVFVPPRGPQVRVAGNVLRPATYEITESQSIGQVVRMAGGFTETADRRRVQIEGIVPPAQRTASGADRRMVSVGPDQFDDVLARGGDIIRVFEIADRVTHRVKVLGNVWSPGVVALTPGMTLQDALRRAGGPKPDTYMQSVLISRLRPDSTLEMRRSALADTTGVPTNNYVLTDGDEITVFSTTDMRPKQFVTVNGAVKNSGVEIPYRDGMTLRDAVLIAGGLVEGALLTEAEVARLPESRVGGITAVPMTVRLDSTYLFARGADGRALVPPGIAVPTGSAPQTLLLPYDAILIKWQPDWQLQQTVTVLGEVRYPGQYALELKTEKLSDIVKRAGGLTSAAYPGGVVFIRQRDRIGRVGIDLAEVMRDPTSIDNLQLMDGDSITIPKFTPVVLIRGAVNSPVGVAYAEGAKLGYYVRSGGGPTAQGERNRAYVMQPNGKVETSRRRMIFWKTEPRPLPGSTVFVPIRDPSDQRNWAQIATAATSILGSLVAIAAIAR